MLIYFRIEIIIVYFTRIYALGGWGHMLPEKMMKIWCVLV